MLVILFQSQFAEKHSNYTGKCTEYNLKVHDTNDILYKLFCMMQILSSLYYMILRIYYTSYITWCKVHSVYAV